jgi:hypothetical protein
LQLFSRIKRDLSRFLIPKKHDAIALKDIDKKRHLQQLKCCQNDAEKPQTNHELIGRKKERRNFTKPKNPRNLSSESSMRYLSESSEKSHHPSKTDKRKMQKLRNEDEQGDESKSRGLKGALTLSKPQAEHKS